MPVPGWYPLGEEWTSLSRLREAWPYLYSDVCLALLQRDDVHPVLISGQFWLESFYVSDTDSVRPYEPADKFVTNLFTRTNFLSSFTSALTAGGEIENFPAWFGAVSTSPMKWTVDNLAAVAATSLDASLADEYGSYDQWFATVGTGGTRPQAFPAGSLQAILAASQAGAMPIGHVQEPTTDAWGRVDGGQAFLTAMPEPGFDQRIVLASASSFLDADGNPQWGEWKLSTGLPGKAFEAAYPLALLSGGEPGETVSVEASGDYLSDPETQASATGSESVAASAAGTPMSSMWTSFDSVTAAAPAGAGRVVELSYRCRLAFFNSGNGLVVPSRQLINELMAIAMAIRHFAAPGASWTSIEKSIGEGTGSTAAEAYANAVADMGGGSLDIVGDCPGQGVQTWDDGAGTFSCVLQSNRARPTGYSVNNPEGHKEFMMDFYANQVGLADGYRGGEDGYAEGQWRRSSSVPRDDAGMVGEFVGTLSPLATYPTPPAGGTVIEGWKCATPLACVRRDVPGGFTHYQE